MSEIIRSKEELINEISMLKIQNSDLKRDLSFYKADGIYAFHNKRMKTFLDAIPIAVCIVNASTKKILFINTSALNLYGINYIDFDLDEHLSEVSLMNIDGTLCLPEEMPINYSLRGQEIRKKELIMIRADGKQIPIIASASPLFNPQGEVDAGIVIFEDITERKIAQDELRDSESKANDLIMKLRKVDEHKNNFISTLSHELRNPLAAISMGISLMEHVTSGSEQDKHTREIIKRQTSQLVRLVDDLLDITRITKNKIELKKENIEVIVLVKDVLEEYKAQYYEKNVILEGRYYTEALYINADSVRIKQVIGNLLSNSLKFTKKDGMVKVTVSKDDSSNEVIINVCDTGIGIAPEFLPNLFEIFVQADNSHARGSGGLGLGLSIVKGIIDLHGGSIAVKSEGLDKGTQFIIKLSLSDEKSIKEKVQVN